VLDVRRGVRPGHHLRIPVIAVATTHLGVVGDVAGGLFEVGGQPAPLDPLGQQVRDILERHVRSPELRHRVIAVLVEHLVVEGGRPGCRIVGVEVGGELVEEEALEGSAVARVTGEQGPLDDLGQTGEREHLAIRIADVAAEQLPLFSAQGLRLGIGHGGLEVVGDEGMRVVAQSGRWSGCGDRCGATRRPVTARAG